MKRIVGILLAVLLLMLVSLLASIGVGHNIYAQSDDGGVSTAVVLFTCIPVGHLQDGIFVERSSRSTGAPAVRIRLGCAQALADLLDQGYSIADVELFSGGEILYTLVRQ